MCYNSQIHFYSFDSDSKISLPLQALLFMQEWAISPHTHIWQSQSVTVSQVIKKLSHLQVRKFCENIEYAQHLVALCFWTQRLRTKEYQKTVPQVRAKGNEETMKSTGLILLCWQQHLNDPRGQRSHCKVFTDPAFQSKESLLLWTAAVPFLQSLLHSSTPSQQNPG